jgi:hypothetical protein
VTDSIFEPVIAALEDAQVRYVVVGGVAVVLRGHPRLTADLDLAIDLAPEEASRAVAVLLGLGLRPRAPVDAADLADPAARTAWIESKGMTVLSFWDPGRPLRVVGVFVEDQIPFDELWERSDGMALGTVTVRVASVADLIRMKEAAGRTQDIEDVAALRAIEDDRNHDA